jgi:hypothetical protein
MIIGHADNLYRSFNTEIIFEYLDGLDIEPSETCRPRIILGKSQTQIKLEQPNVYLDIKKNTIARTEMPIFREECEPLSVLKHNSEFQSDKNENVGFLRHHISISEIPILTIPQKAIYKNTAASIKHEYNNRDIPQKPNNKDLGVFNDKRRSVNSKN